MEINTDQQGQCSKDLASHDSGLKDSSVDAGESALKPCPFCGSRAIIVSKFAERSPRQEFRAECAFAACRAAADWFFAPEGATVAWNLRTSNPAIEELLAAAREALEEVGDNARWWDELHRVIGGEVNAFQKVTFHARAESCAKVSDRLRTAIENYEEAK